MKKGNQSIPSALKESNKIVWTFHMNCFSFFFYFWRKKKAKCLTLSLALSVFGVDDWMNDTHTHTHTLAPPAAPSLAPVVLLFLFLEWSRTFLLICWFWMLYCWNVSRAPPPSPSPKRNKTTNGKTSEEREISFNEEREKKKILISMLFSFFGAETNKKKLKNGKIWWKMCWRLFGCSIVLFLGILVIFFFWFRKKTNGDSAAVVCHRHRCCCCCCSSSCWTFVSRNEDIGPENKRKKKISLQNVLFSFIFSRFRYIFPLILFLCFGKQKKKQFKERR